MLIIKRWSVTQLIFSLELPHDVGQVAMVCRGDKQNDSACVCVCARACACVRVLVHVCACMRSCMCCDAWNCRKYFKRTAHSHCTAFFFLPPFD